MAKDKLTDYDATASGNTDVGGINIQGTAMISTVDNALREFMSHLAETNAGTYPVDDTWTFCDPADKTKKFRLDGVGVTAGQTRVLTVPDASGTLSLTSNTRELLTAARTYYVRSDGSDSNTGLADTAGGAFLTIGKALTVTAALDISVYNVTISVASGTWTTALTVSAPWIGSGTVTLQGNGGTLNVTGTCVTVTGSGSRLTVSGFTLVASVIGLDAKLGATITIGTSMVFGACSSMHMRATGTASMITSESTAYSVTGAAPRHLYSASQGSINVFNATITITGTLNFSTTFADADRLAYINAGSATIDISGATVTGKRFNVASGSVINTSGGGANFFPGDSAGTGTNPGASPYGLYI